MQEFTPMQRVETAPMNAANKRQVVEAIRQAQPEISDREIHEIIKGVATAEIWRNSLYSVFVKRGVQFPAAPPNMIHLLIRRNDGQPGRNWSHFQRIKNEVLGEQFEAVELYPAENRVLRAGNEYHLWAQGQLGPDGETPGYPWGFFDTEADEPMEEAEAPEFHSGRPGAPQDVLGKGKMIDYGERLLFAMRRASLSWQKASNRLDFRTYASDDHSEESITGLVSVTLPSDQFGLICKRAPELTARQMSEILQRMH